jgi:peptidyl-prolyl cis-trans isomerase SurA
MKKIIITLYFLIIAWPAFAIEHKVAAIVNDEVITDIDLKKRVALIIKSSGMENNQQSVALVKGQALQVMIDEKLIDLEAKKLGIEVEEEEVADALKGIADNNGLKPEDLGVFLSQGGLDKATLVEQIKHQLLWNKIIRLSLQPKITVSSQEVEENAKSIKQAILSAKDTADHSEQVKLAEIVMYAKDKKQAKSKLALAREVVKRIRNGADFTKMVTQFSQAGSVGNNGELGWVYVFQLMPDLQKTIKNLNIGDVSDPIIMDDGVHILKISNRKSNKPKDNTELDEVQIKEILLGKKLEVLVRSNLMQMRNHAYISIK